MDLLDVIDINFSTAQCSRLKSKARPNVQSFAFVMPCCMLWAPQPVVWGSGLRDQRADSLKLGDLVIVGCAEREVTKIVNKKDCFSVRGTMFDTGGKEELRAPGWHDCDLSS